MSTGLHYLDLGIGIAVFAGIFWWMYALCARPSPKHKLERVARKTAHQPWDNDKSGGRGNR